jgi:hypothetical protein
MIAFKQDTEITVINEFDEATDNIVDESKELFKAGELVDGEVISTEILPDGKVSDYVDIQFGDGGLAMGVLRSSFDVL